MKLAQLAQLNCCFRSIHLLAGDLSPASAFRHFTLLHRAAPDYSPGDLLVAPDVFLPRDEDALSECAFVMKGGVRCRALHGGDQ